MKNVNGYGTVKKLSGKRRRPFVFLVTEGYRQKYDANGVPVGKAKQVQRPVAYFETRREALAFQGTYSYHLKRDEPLPTQTKAERRIDLAPRFIDEWNVLKRLESGSWAEGTLAYRENLISKHCTAVHDLPVDKITTGILTEKVMLPYMELGKTAASCSLLKNSLSIVFEQAIDDGWITVNPCSRLHYKETKEKARKEVYPPELIKRISRNGSRIADLLLVLIYTGMRISELIEMKRENVHIDEHYMVGGNKTKAGKNRIIPIHPAIDAIIRRWYAAEAETLFVGDEGHSVCRYTLQKNFDRFREKEGFSLTFHEARHTFITLCAQHGVSPEAARRMTGHAGVDVHDTVYTHLGADFLYTEVCKIPMPDKL